MVRRGLFVLLGILIAADIYVAATLPVTSAEAVVYSRSVAQPILNTWSTPFDTHIGIPYAWTARVVKWLAGVSELSLRLPAVLGGALFGIALIGIPPGWRSAALAILFLVSEPLHVFSTAGGLSLALGFAAVALRLMERSPWLAGICAGLAIASAPLSFVGPLTLLMAADYAKRRSFWVVADQFVIPTCLVACLFLSPWPLSSGKPKPASTMDKATRDLILLIPPTKNTKVGVSEALEPSLTFYRRRFHRDGITPAQPDGPDHDAGYYLLSEQDRYLVTRRSLRILQTKSGEILAAR